MRWITREYVHVDRTACPWLIKKFIDPHAEFIFVPADKIDQIVDEGGIPFDVPGIKLGHHDGKCSFESVLDKYKIEDPVLYELAKIIHAADTDDTSLSPEGIGLDAIMTGIRLNSMDDYDAITKAELIYDALYSYLKYKLISRKYEDKIKGMSKMERREYLQKKIREPLIKKQF